MLSCEVQVSVLVYHSFRIGGVEYTKAEKMNEFGYLGCTLSVETRQHTHTHKHTALIFAAFFLLVFSRISSSLFILLLKPCLRKNDN